MYCIVLYIFIFYFIFNQPGLNLWHLFPLQSCFFFLFVVLLLFFKQISDVCHIRLLKLLSEIFSPNVQTALSSLPRFIGAECVKLVASSPQGAWRR